MKLSQRLSDFFIGILFLLFFLSLAVIFVINLRTLYYMNITKLNISELSGLSNDIIRLNYDALIDYCSPFFSGTLAFPTLPSSPAGLQHFEEVKNIFVFFYYLLPVSIILLLPLLFYKHKKGEYHYLLISSILILVLPVIAGVLIYINFDFAFILFHKIFFRNDYWIFDAVTDPVITILPAEFFMHCALVIILFLLLGSIALLASYYVKRRQHKLQL